MPKKTKLFKRYSNAQRCCVGDIEAVTLDGIPGFMPAIQLMSGDQLDYEMFSDVNIRNHARHLRLVALPNNLYGIDCFDSTGKFDHTETQKLVTRIFSSQDRAYTEFSALKLSLTTSPRWRYAECDETNVK